MSAEAAGLDTPSWVAAILDQFEAARFFDEGDVAGHIFAAAKKVESPTPEEKKAADAECWAFRFHPQPPGEESEWKTHFGPVFVRGDFRNPDIAWLDQSVVKYWEKRMTAAKHPLLRARYADLVWDLSKPACSLKAPIDAARIAIDGYVAAGALTDADSAMTASDRLQRGLRLAVSVGDQPRVEQARGALVALFTRVNEAWGWVTLFDMFEESPKIKLTDAQKDAMVAGLEAHVTEVAGKPEGVDPGGSLHVAARLVRHYQRAGRQPDADRVVMACGQAAERYAAAADHTRAHFWLDQVLKFYRINGLDAEAERVQLEARRRGELARGEAQAVSAEVDVPPDELGKFLTELTDGGLNAALQRIAGHFVPHLDTLRDRLQRFRKEFPMATMWPIAKMAEGQVVAQIGPVDTDPEGALINAVADEIRHGRFFLERALDRLRERYSVTADQIVDFLFESVAFTVGFRGIIHQGVEAYLAGDHPKAISLLVPQIENGLRFLLPLLGRPPNKPKRGDQPGMTEKTLTDILEYEPVIKDKFGEDTHLYMVAFLADARGLNIRNRMCHGLMMEEDFNRWVSDRVLHTMLMLGMCRRKKEPAAPLPEAAKPADQSGAIMAKKGKKASTYTDREVLEMFVEATDELSASTFADQVRKGVRVGFLLVPEGIETRVAGPEHEATKAFLLTLRLFGQDNDETSLQNMAARVQALAVSQTPKDRFLKSQDNFNAFLDSLPHVQVPDKDADTKRKIFEAFLYGIYAHTAEEHHRTVKGWREQPYYADLEAQFYVILTHFLAAVTAMASACRDMLKEMPTT